MEKLEKKSSCASKGECCGDCKKKSMEEFSNNFSNKDNGEPFVIRAFYRFVDLPNYERLQKPFKKFCVAHSIKGTILIASEGVNSTLSGTREAMDKFFHFLDQDARLKNMPFKESYAEFQPFEKMKVRLKKEIVRLGVEGLDISKRGKYVKGFEWDKLLEDPEVVLVDTRNIYEYKLGTFKGALDPNTEDFRSFPKWVDENLDPKKHKKVAMFCTGGIRCEKSTALLLNKGFDDVYHLDGGILQYFKDTGNKNEKWKGQCFVFDDRIAVNEKLERVESVICKKCGHVLTIDDVRWGVNHKGVNCESFGLQCINGDNASAK
jgi:UPF0176 protein